MIDYVSGTIVEKSPERVLIDIGGVGLSLQISFATYQALGQVGSSVKLLSHLHFREPTFELFGFASAAERDMFLLLIQVSGVGVRVARTILSGMGPRELRQAIVDNDVSRLAQAPGIGTKTAERLVVFLRDKAITMGLSKEAQVSPLDRIEGDAIAALVSLGIPPNTSQRAVRKVIRRLGSSIELDQLVKESLKLLF